jgi:hypothetical protein
MITEKGGGAIYLASSPSVQQVTGRGILSSTGKYSHQIMQNLGRAAALWKISEKLTSTEK